MLAPQAARHATVCQDILRDAVASERVERAIYVVMGDYLAAAGWLRSTAGICPQPSATSMQGCVPPVLPVRAPCRRMCGA
jgi:hypothetical protein